MNAEDSGDDFSDILNQSDIDRLMEEAQGTPSGVVYNLDGEKFGPGEKINIESYDFRNPVFLTETELRQIRIRHEKFVHYLSARLSMFLRLDTQLKMSKLYTTTYQKFTESVPNPTFISLFKIDKLEGIGIMDVNPRLAMTFINRMLGGKGHSIKDERYLTEIEITLMEDITNIILFEWCRQWTEYPEMEPALIGQENSGRFLNTASPDAIVLVLDIEVAIGDCSETIQLCFPYFMIEPIIKKMHINSLKFNQGKHSEKPKAAWAKSYDNITVPVSAEWEPFEIQVRDLLNLRPGDIIEMPENAVRNTRLRLMNTVCFIGEAGINEDHNAVKITRKHIGEK